MTPMRRQSFVVTLASVALSGCAHAVSTKPFEDIAAGGEPLRTAFNRAANKVRIVMLVSPT